MPIFTLYLYNENEAAMYFWKRAHLSSVLG